jgi:hypothetical protein
VKRGGRQPQGCAALGQNATGTRADSREKKPRVKGVGRIKNGDEEMASELNQKF